MAFTLSLEKAILGLTKKNDIKTPAAKAFF